MSEEWRDKEVDMRETAQVHAGEIVPGSGSRGTPRRMAHMASVRLDGELISRLRFIARQRGVTVSDLLREGAELVAEGQYIEETEAYVTTMHGAFQQRTVSRPGGRVPAFG